VTAIPPVPGGDREVEDTSAVRCVDLRARNGLDGEEAVMSRVALVSPLSLTFTDSGGYADEGGNQGDSRHHGFLTIEAVSRPEVNAPNRARVFNLAITARDGRGSRSPIVMVGSPGSACS